MLDSEVGMKSEKEVIPNLSLRGFEKIDFINLRVEGECPATVSCADIVALAGRESVLLAGGQFYPVLTGRLDSMKAFPDQTETDLPGPDFVIARAVKSFADKGFSPREMVALLGFLCIFYTSQPWIASELFSFSVAPGGYSRVLIYCNMSWYHGLPSGFSSIFKQ